MTSTSAHQAIYRRWRAQTFSEIVGQEPVVTTLRNAIRTGRLSHALLFVGPRGTGKTSLARIVAKALNCTDLRDGEPCDRCPACVSIREGRALDVVEMDAASNNRVDDIRELLPRIQTAPSDLRRKVFIVDEVQRIKEGWDVLLKTLEEPPAHVAFIFCTTDSSQVRPAVLSRVQRFDFRRLTVPEIEGKLETILRAEGRTADPDALESIARLAAGGMRDAESMLDQLLASGGDRIDAGRVRALLGLAEAETVSRFADALVAGDASAGLAILADLEDRGVDLRVFLDQVVEGLRTDISARLAEGAGAAELAGPATAAAALAALDPTRPGTGGLRLRLEILFLVPGARPALPASSSASGSAPSRAGAGARPSLEIPAVVVPPGAPGPFAGDQEVARPFDAGVRSGTDPAVPDARDADQTPVAATLEAPPASPRTRRRPTREAQAAVAAAEPGIGAEPDAGEEPIRAEQAAVMPAPPAAVRLDGGPEPSDAASLAALREQWPEIVAYISAHPPTKPLISACRPIAVEGDVVTLGFPEGQAFLAEVAKKRGPQLEAGIGHFLGRPVAVNCVATNVDLAPGPVDAEGARLLAEARRIFADDLTHVEEVR